MLKNRGHFPKIKVVSWKIKVMSRFNKVNCLNKEQINGIKIKIAQQVFNNRLKILIQMILLSNQFIMDIK